MMTLSQLMSYNTEHLIDAAAHWRALADQREEVFATVRNEAYALPWEGLGADAVHARTRADSSTATGSAEDLRAAAMIAQDSAGTLDQMHSRVLYTIEDAQTDGFTPTEVLQFVDTRPSTNPAVIAQRQAQAQAYSGQLKSQVAALYTHDTQVGTDMTNATAGEGKIQFVDHTFKADGGPVCDDPDYEDGITRRIAAATIGGAMAGGATGIPGGPALIATNAFGGALLGGLGELWLETSGDGPRCK
jgi:hypothetical protein